MRSRTHRALALIALCALVGPAEAATVHIRGGDGQWQEVEAEEAGGVVSFSIAPEQAAGGRALVVINKPDWMVLDDAQPPRVVGYAIGEESVALQAGRGMDLGGLADEQRVISFDVVDDANPVDTQSMRLEVSGGDAARFEVVAEDRQARSATVRLDLSGLGPGAYDGSLTVADLSPLANEAAVPLRFSIAGAEVAADGQSVSLAGGGAGFTARAQWQENVVVDAAEVSAYLTVQAGGAYLYCREFRNLEVLGERNGWQIVQADAALRDKDGQPFSDEEAGLHLSYRFGVHPDHPALMVMAEATNLADAERELYCFWGWLPGDGYVTAQGEHEWSMQYDEIGPVGWVYLPARRGDLPGVGWISDQVFGESRFGTMLLYTDPKHVPTGAGEAVRTLFAITPADAPEEVAEEAAALVAAGIIPAPGGE
ncbi:MAG: hypothetical protein U9R79_05990 [Armatimonadota bacterium]|nr:hypothetical protein [Armatimonadota bacterium]